MLPRSGRPGRVVQAAFLCCHGRRPWLGTARRRDLFLKILEETRQRHRFVVLGYVVMPEHVHLLITEPLVGDPSKVMQVVKQRFAQKVIGELRDQGQPVGSLGPCMSGRLGFTISMSGLCGKRWRS